MKALLQAGLIVVTGALLTGCSSPTDEVTGSRANNDDSEYVYYTPTGSHIPIRVRRSDMKTTPAESAQSQALMERWQRWTRGAPPRS